MPPVPTRQKRQPERAQQDKVTTDDVVDGLGYTLTQILNRNRREAKMQAQETQQAIDELNEGVAQASRTQTAENDGTEETVSVTFTQVMAGKTYRVELTDLSWWVQGTSQIEIGYWEGEDYTRLMLITTVPEEPIEVTIPDEASPDSIEVIITGACSTQVNLIDITETEDTMQDLTVPDAGLDQTQIDNILHNLGLDTIIQDFEQRISDLEQRVSDLEEAE